MFNMNGREADVFLVAGGRESELANRRQAGVERIFPESLGSMEAAISLLLTVRPPGECEADSFAGNLADWYC